MFFEKPIPSWGALHIAVLITISSDFFKSHIKGPVPSPLDLNFSNTGYNPLNPDERS